MQQSKILFIYTYLTIILCCSALFADPPEGFSRTWQDTANPRSSQGRTGS
jgi:hypothetical protein